MSVASITPPVRKRDARRPFILISLAVALATLVLSVLVGHAHSGMTVFDEGVHFDYIVKLVDEPGKLPDVASKLSPRTLKVMSCRGGMPWREAADCSDLLTNNRVPVEGVNYVLMYAPVYYGVVAVVAGPVSAFTGLDLFVLSRAMSSVLYAAGALLFALALLRLRTPWPVAAGMTLALVSSGLMLFQGSTVSPDSMALLFGGAIILILTIPWKWKQRLLAAVVVAVLAGINKANFIPFACAGIVLVGLAPDTPFNDSGKSQVGLFHRGWKRTLLVICLAATPLVAEIAWNAWRVSSLPPGVAADGGLNIMLYTDRPLTQMILESARLLVQPFTQTGFSESLVLSVFAGIFQLFVFGGAFLLCIVPRFAPDSGVRMLTLTGVAGLALSILFLPTTFYLLYHASAVQPRYGLPIAVLLTAAVTASIGDGRLVKWLILAGGLGFYLLTLVKVLSA